MLPINIKREFCCYCGEEFDAITIIKTVDHLIPKCKGGTNTTHNKKNCCSICNGQKGSMYPEQFLFYNLKKYYHLYKMKKRHKIDNQSELCYYEIRIENIKHVINYVELAEDLLFVDNYYYKVYLEEKDFTENIMLAYKIL